MSSDSAGKPVRFYAGLRAPKGKLERLIKAQGKRPIHDLDEISALWPSDDDPDAFLELILQERRARRLGLGYGRWSEHGSPEAGELLEL